MIQASKLDSATLCVFRPGVRSSALICNRGDLPVTGRPEMTDGYRTYLGLCSHEYFHTWNVKRIKPAAFAPYDLSQENYTSLLWLFEGFTSYYDDLMLVRSGVIAASDYFTLLGKTIGGVLRGSGRLKQSVAESSFERTLSPTTFTAVTL